jgi:hypothetical protein
MIRRVLVVLSVAACTLVGLSPVGPAAAEPTVTLGRTGGSMPSTCGGAPDLEIFQLSTAAGIPTTAPFAGVVTSWSFLASTQNTVLTLRVFRHVSASTFTAVADGGPLQTVPAGTGLHTYPTRIPVQRGDFIGLRATQGGCAAQTGNTNDTALFRADTATPVGSSGTYDAATPGFIENIAATLEPDADADGFGDVSQDQCPSLASTQGRCDTAAPETTITKKPKARSGVSTVVFASSETGSTFSCALDGKAARPCSSPVSFVCLKPGKHTFSVVATDAAGNVDASPATKKFRLKRDRRGC